MPLNFHNASSFKTKQKRFGVHCCCNVGTIRSSIAPSLCLSPVSTPVGSYGTTVSSLINWVMIAYIIQQCSATQCLPGGDTSREWSPAIGIATRLSSRVWTQFNDKTFGMELSTQTTEVLLSHVNKGGMSKFKHSETYFMPISHWAKPCPPSKRSMAKKMKKHGMLPMQFSW